MACCCKHGLKRWAMFMTKFFAYQECALDRRSLASEIKWVPIPSHPRWMIDAGILTWIEVMRAS
eukprot:1142825-Pelagomonas_calceolata.AAC.2